MRKAIFFDIDGTIWDFKGNIPDSVPETLRRLQDNGHLTFLNSGRSRSNIIDERLLSLPLTGIVAACGGHIEIDGKLVHEELMSWPLASRARDVLAEEHMPVVFEGPEYHWMNTEDFEDDPFVNVLWEKLGDRAKRLDEMKEGDRISKFSADITEKTNWQRVRRLLGDEIDFLDHNGVVVEFILKGTGKAAGIRRVCELLGIAREDTFALGDSVNDLDMLEYAGTGICMGNGTRPAKDAADYITAPLKEDGILRAMEHFRLL